MQNIQISKYETILLLFTLQGYWRHTREPKKEALGAKEDPKGLRCVA